MSLRMEAQGLNNIFLDLSSLVMLCELQKISGRDHPYIIELNDLLKRTQVIPVYFIVVSLIISSLHYWYIFAIGILPQRFGLLAPGC